MAASSSRYTHISLGSMADKIQLTDRQLQILEKRRQRLDGVDTSGTLMTEPVKAPRKAVDPSGSHSFGDEPTQTAPTVSWDGSSSSREASEAGSNNSFSNPQQAFYGQRLKGEAKKLYDDTGASYYESKSETSAGGSSTSHSRLEASTAALTETMARNEEATEVGSSASNQKDQEKKAYLKKKLLGKLAEKHKDQTKPPVLDSQSNDKPKSLKMSLGLNRPKKSGGKDDQQRNFLRNLMQSAYTSKDSKSKDQDTSEESSSSVSAPSAAGSRFSLARKSLASSASGSSSASHDKAIMRKVLERTRKKKASNTPRKANLIKTSSSRIKKILSPRKKPDDPALEEMGLRNDNVGSPRTPRRSPRNQRGRRDKRSKSPRPSRPQSPVPDARSRWSSDANSEADHEENYTNLMSRESLMGRPSMINENEIEIEVSASAVKQAKFVSAITESLMEPVDMPSPEHSPVKRANGEAGGSSAVDHQKESQQPSKTSGKIVENEEPEGYADFMSTLKSEVAGSHSQLWESFQRLFQDPNAEIETMPLAEVVNYQFDDKTKDIVTNISTYLKKNHKIVCSTGTQLANDKAVREIPVAQPVFGQHLLKRNQIPMDSVIDSDDESEYESEYDSDKENGGAIVQVPSADTIDDGPGGNEFEVTLGQFVRKNVGGPLEKNKSAASFVPMNNEAINLQLSSKKLRPTGIQTTEMKPVQGAENPMISPKNLRPTGGLKKLEAKSKGQGSINTQHPLISPKNLKPTGFGIKAGSKASNDLSNVKLRHVEGNKAESANSSIPASWAKVKLRPVGSKAQNNPASKPAQNTAPQDNKDEQTDFRRIIVSKKRPSQVEAQKAKTKDDPIEIIDLADIEHTEENPIDLVDKTNEGDPIDLTDIQTPKTSVEEQSHAGSKVSTAWSTTSDGSVLVSLADEESDPVKIIIGKKGLAKIEYKLGETKAKVIWRHCLDDIRSAMLDLSTFKMKLILNTDGGHKDLAFATSEQCMIFANALHDLTTSENGEDGESSAHEEESVFVEQLNDEEQRVLEEFRRNKSKGIATVAVPQLSLSTVKELPSIIDAEAQLPGSPLSDASGPGAPLSTDEMKAATPYQKMLKLGIPKDAVKHKMTKDQVDKKIIDFVLAGSSDETNKSGGLTVEEEKKVQTYQKMLKMRIPAEAVRHKMEKEGVSSKIVEAVLGAGGVFRKPAPASTPALTPAEEIKAAPYRKMLKMMIPKEAVEHKMKKDQIDQKIINAVLGITSDAAPTKPKSANVVPTLTDEEEAVASAYRKMVTLRIPKEAIRKKMTTEGISKKIVAAVLGEKLTTTPTNNNPRKRGKQGFHWSPLVSDANLKNSVWSKSSFDSAFLEDDDDISSHVDQFSKKPESDDASRATARSTSDTKEMAKLIDLGRANNVAITLKAFNDFTHAELAQAIEFLDPFGKIKGDRALFMKGLLPAVAEVKVVKNYDGEDDRLVPAEKWFRQIVHIKRIEEKIHVLRTIESFRNEALALGETFEKLTKVCNEVMNSEKLPDLLEMVRQIGNRMNDGRGEEAMGFKMDFLPRLAQTKGSDKKTTALDLVVMIFMTRERREALMLGKDFPDCQEVSRMQVGELLSDVRMLNGAMRKCQKELDSLRKESGKQTRSRVKKAQESLSESGAQKPSLHKLLGIQDDEARTEVSSMHQELFARRAKLIDNALDSCDDRAQMLHDGDKVSPRASLLITQQQQQRSEFRPSYNIEGAINRIDIFLEEAKLIFPELEKKRDIAISACKELSEFFCEPGGERIAPSLLGILSEFALNLNRAVQKYDHQQKAEARKKASKEKKEQSSSVSPKNAETRKSKVSKEKKSLVLMVNEMLKVAGDKQKADFIKGVTYENPDSRMKEIYAAEHEKNQIGSPSPRKNILRTIQERQQLHDPQSALSELALAMQKRTLSTDSLSPKSDASSEASSMASSMASSLGETEVQLVPKNRYRRSIADRWSSKVDDDDEVDEGEFVINTKPSDEDNDSVGKTDSQILRSDSHDTEDREFEEKKKQQMISRWASNNSMLKESKDLEEESDIGTSMELMSKTRQKYMNRWASKPDDDNGDTDSDFLLR